MAPLVYFIGELKMEKGLEMAKMKSLVEVPQTMSSLVNDLGQAYFESL